MSLKCHALQSDVNLALVKIKILVILMIILTSKFLQIPMIKVFATCAIAEESASVSLAQCSWWPDLIVRPYVEKLIVVQPRRGALGRSLVVSVFVSYLMKY